MERGDNRMDQQDPQNTAFVLSDADALAVDALLGDESTRGAPSAERTARLEATLALLNPVSLEAAGGERRRSLIDATLARALRTPRTTPGDGSLLADDAAAVDALVENDWRAASMAGPAGERARRIEKALAHLDAPPAGVGMSKEMLVEATLGRVDAEIRRREALMRASATDLDGRGGRGRFTLSDVASIAAMLVFAMGVLWPMAASWREAARRQDCAGNLAMAGEGFDMYAKDHDGRMPMATAGFGGGSWWNVGDPKHSHSSNLFTLAKNGYNSLEELSCTGNPMALLKGDARQMDDWRSIDEISFSYQLPARKVMIWNGPARVVVLADRSPVIERALRGERFDPEARSLNHRGRGQNVLMSDGSVIFLSRPVLENGDNIWLPNSITDSTSGTLHGTERPSGETDAFVAP